jgi:uncharacterized protein
MMQRPTANMLLDGKRLHLHHGPIDLIIGADGSNEEIKSAYNAAENRFQTILDELVSELPTLRTAVPEFGLHLQGDIARTMAAAVQPFWRFEITPMAAVAGSVAQHVLSAMMSASQLTRAFVNNGGDIAFHLAPGESFTVAAPAGEVTVKQEDDARGIATSGWRGRSHSLGIADAVTVLAQSAAQADAAATIIANAVDLPLSPKIKRMPARDLFPESDLGERPVTVDVAELSDEEILEALGNGVSRVQSLFKHYLFEAVSLQLGRQVISLNRTHIPELEDADA